MMGEETKSLMHWAQCTAWQSKPLYEKNSLSYTAAQAFLLKDSGFACRFLSCPHIAFEEI
jgi:hypothetical protein